MRSWLKWFGGKSHFLKYLFPFPQHTIYTEPFGGSGVVLLNKPISKIEVYNDLNGRLVNAWQCLQNHLEELKFLMNYQGSIRSRTLFNQYKIQSPDNLEDAFRFFYINRYSFSGDMNTFAGVSLKQDERNNTKEYQLIIQILHFIQTRIKNVMFECQDFRNILTRFNSENVFTYIDIPYKKGGAKYAKMIGNIPEWTKKDYWDLIHLLYKFKGKFLLSTDLIDGSLFDWHITSLVRTNNFYRIVPLNNEIQTRTKDIEYLISNYDPAKVQTQSEKNQNTLDQLTEKRE